MINVDEACAWVQEALRERADPEAALSMMAYMKTEMPFYGVKSPNRKEIARSLHASYPPAGCSDVWSMVDSLWSLPHRE